MLLYAIIMFAISILFIAISVSIYKGNTKLIHDYHQTKVTDQKAYGKAFGKALLIIGTTPLASGVISLMGDSDPIAITAVSVLGIGFCIGLVCIYAVQKKYNGGLF